MFKPSVTRQMTPACVITQDEQQRIGWIGGSCHSIALSGGMTDGRLTVLRSELMGGTGAPVHVHPHEDETLHLLSGSAVVWAGTRKWQVGAGDTVFLARGVPHTYRITSDKAELLTICTPSGMERFFQSAGWDLSASPIPDDWSVDIAGMQAAAAEFGQEILGAPLQIADLMPKNLTTWPIG